MRSTIAWGLTRGLTRVTLSALQGALDLRSVYLHQALGGARPVIVPTTEAVALPLLTVWGNSITSGDKTLGLARNSDGWVDRLATARGLRVSNKAVGGSSASCYGRGKVEQVIATDPDLVIVAYGTNDMLPGPDFFGCDATMETFREAMDAMLTELEQGLPGVPLYLGAILPTARVPEATRAEWNAVLHEVAAAHGTPVVDPSPALDLALDYADGLHPHNRGHASIAAVWDVALG
jgi:lysophospholipase L1-like esterase